MDLGLRIVPFVLLLALFALLDGRVVIALWTLTFLGLPTMRSSIGPVPVYWCDVSAVAACFVCLRWPVTPASRNLSKWFWWLVLVHLLGVLTSFVRYGAVLEPTYEAFRYWIAFLPLVLLPRIAEDEEVMQWFWHGVVLSALGMMSLALIQTYWRDLALQVGQFFYGARTQNVGLAYHERMLLDDSANIRVYAMYSTSTCLAGAASMVAALLMFRMTQVKASLLAQLGLLAAAVTMLLTFSRHGLLAWAVMVLPSFLRRPKRGIAILGLLGVLVGLLGAGDFWAERIGRGGVKEDGNLSSRLVDRPLELLERIEEEPSILFSGVGLGTDHLARRGMDDGPSRYGFVSNGFALYLFYLGLFAVGVVIALLAATAMAAWELEPDLRAVALGAVGAAVVVIASDNYGFLHSSFPFMWAVVVALIHSQVPGALAPSEPEHDAELAVAR